MARTVKAHRSNVCEDKWEISDNKVLRIKVGNKEMKSTQYHILVLSLLLTVIFGGCRKAPNEVDSATQNKISINIDKFFEYVSKGGPLGLSVGQTPAVGLSTKPYEVLNKEAEYGSGQVLYGYIPLGNSDDPNISFAVDRSSSDNWVIYIDTNNNEDLTDDGPPRSNEGTGKFAALISLHVEVISASGDKTVRPYQLWFWLAKSEFPRFYTRCHYRSQISIGEKQYTAIAYEIKKHDALYRESGLWIDLDGDGKLDKSEEHFQDAAVISIEGKEYVLSLNYP